MLAPEAEALLEIEREGPVPVARLLGVLFARNECFDGETALHEAPERTHISLRMIRKKQGKQNKENTKKTTTKKENK